MSGQLGRVGYYGTLPSRYGAVLHVVGITGSERSIVVRTSHNSCYVTMEPSSSTWPLTTIYRADLFTSADLLVKEGHKRSLVKMFIADLCNDSTIPQFVAHSWLIVNLIVAGYYTEDDSVFCVGRADDTCLVGGEVEYMAGIIERLIHKSLS